MRKIPLTLLLLSYLSAQHYAESFLEIGAYPRSIGLGQAVVALVANSSGYLQNPAATGFNQGTEFNLMYVNQFGLADFSALTSNYNWREKWQAGINLVNLSIAGIPERPDLRQIIDLETRRDSIRTLVSQGFSTFKDRETGLTLNLVRNIDYIIDLGWYVSPAHVRQPVGLNIKLLQKQLYDMTGYGIGIDLGTMFEIETDELTGYSWIGDLTLGLAVTDAVGTLIYWTSGKNDRIDPELLMGLGYRQPLSPRLGDITFLVQQGNETSRSNWGIEFAMFRLVNIRLGKFYGEIQGGIGIAFPIYGVNSTIDYSFTAHDLGDCHRIGFGIRL